ncbi:hypothetical protein PSQ39_01485 [Curvibacter sp. HBC28]|uniref:Uncharacterized protein n=1 Tax=Curvibacter microcysteis TaxID=3026419 RepID=A0ABT5M9N2_9BURK|nr:hypothetical protein [Curvibacter sp. HBC28]MDD0813294.1 hypothetical protein [Curvibacter sp. HBC28]
MLAEVGQAALRELEVAKDALAQQEQRVNEPAQAWVQHVALLLTRHVGLERSLQPGTGRCCIN